MISRDQSTPIIEVEGPLLSDTHVTFKVSGFSQPHATASPAYSLKLKSFILLAFVWIQTLCTRTLFSLERIVTCVLLIVFWL